LIPAASIQPCTGPGWPARLCLGRANITINADIAIGDGLIPA
jgi:hypothetical protein